MNGEAEESLASATEVPLEVGSAGKQCSLLEVGRACHAKNLLAGGGGR